MSRDGKWSHQFCNPCIPQIAPTIPSHIANPVLGTKPAPVSCGHSRSSKLPSFVTFQHFLLSRFYFFKCHQNAGQIVIFIGILRTAPCNNFYKTQISAHSNNINLVVRRTCAHAQVLTSPIPRE